MGEAALRLSRIVFLGNLRSPGQLINLGARWCAGWRGPRQRCLEAASQQPREGLDCDIGRNSAKARGNDPKAPKPRLSG